MFILYYILLWNIIFTFKIMDIFVNNFLAPTIFRSHGNGGVVKHMFSKGASTHISIVIRQI
jgi:ribosomal protein L35AE/L33A